MNEISNIQLTRICSWRSVVPGGNGESFHGTVRIRSTRFFRFDPKAAWRDDKLYLPEDVILTNLPAHPPTGGWAALDDQAGIGVSLPATDVVSCTVA